ncbi:MAG: ABC transporter ATP-binding protein [Boseongicola sp. SB0664_bin_43]|uniref:ABC transporter ATP-binding protein n=1 Tax=Boseongicola sp. SB0664_bin_43 TaxID=2604844 RepID=A0A6B0XX96_9RHOB|nr:ABC transporter ATP-binding protein [Boseongicola sp. SB0664_bin_43]MYK31975.1 ABC transporter ATP-binding protein [Boseongicola sp. SB0670_bin_30]
MCNEPLLDVRNLTTVLDLAAGTTPVVDDVSFTVGRGETLGIVGESGSGKSMTANSIIQVLPKKIGRIAGGQILFDGKDLSQFSDADLTKVRGREIAMILQDPHTSLNPVYTIGNQVIEALKLDNPQQPKRSLLGKAIDVLKKVNVADAERRLYAYPHQMSGGMKQRVVGAIAFSSAPKLIIADEPTTALDVTIQLQYLQLLEGIQKNTGAAIIFITHDLGIVAHLCHRLAVMYGGRIVESGTVKDVFAAPSHPYTQALLKSVPSIDAKVARLYAIQGQPPPLTEKTAGCKFAPRCPLATDVCRSQRPSPKPGRSGAASHEASCWHLGETL